MENINIVKSKGKNDKLNTKFVKGLIFVIIARIGNQQIMELKGMVKDLNVIGRMMMKMSFVIVFQPFLNLTRNQTVEHIKSIKKVKNASSTGNILGITTEKYGPNADYFTDSNKYIGCIQMTSISAVRRLHHCITFFRQSNHIKTS